MVSIFVNGSPIEEFHMERGLRQGDPLSPFLFLITAEGLHVMMKAVVDQGLFKPYGLGTYGEVTIPNLQFAYDTLPMRVKSWLNIRALKAVLVLF